MDYKYDVFLSYTHGFIAEWVHKTFLPLFEWHLEGALGEQPRIFYDRQGILTGDYWPLQLKVALAHSKCLVAIWSPSYFDSLWCMREFAVMLDREQKLGYRTKKRPDGLVLPVTVSDGDHFPDYARNIQHFDCRRFARVGKGFKKTKRYVDLQDEITDWARNVAKVINQTFPWSSDWLDDSDVIIPDTSHPIIEQPVLE